MNHQLYVNELIKWNPGQENEYVERILWIDSCGPILYVIDVNSSEGLPKAKRVDDIISALETGEAEKLEEDLLFGLSGKRISRILIGKNGIKRGW